MQTRFEIIKNRVFDVQKEVNNEVTFMLYRLVSGSLSFISGNSHDTPEGRKLIESIYAKNNSYLLMDRPYEDNKTIALAKAHGFHTVVPPKKNHKSTWLHDKQLYKQCNNIKQYFLRLKRFRKVFICYDKLDSIFISNISLSFSFDLLFYVNTA